MKKRNKKQIAKRRKQFRFHKIEVVKKTGKKKNIYHPAYVFLEKGNIYIYVSLTHSSQIKDRIVIKLNKNPNPIDYRDSYVVIDFKEDIKDRFTTRRQDWLMEDKDDIKIRKMYNQKPLENNKKDDSADRISPTY